MFYNVQLSREFHDKSVWVSDQNSVVFMLYLNILGTYVKLQKTVREINNKQMHRKFAQFNQQRITKTES
jgi:hypothetical protein